MIFKKIAETDFEFPDAIGRASSGTDPLFQTPDRPLLRLKGSLVSIEGKTWSASDEANQFVKDSIVLDFFASPFTQETGHDSE